MLPSRSVKGLTEAIARAQARLLSLQAPDGHWVGELQGDTILESEYVMLMAFLGREHHDKIRKAGRYILTQERPDGGWSRSILVRSTCLAVILS